MPNETEGPHLIETATEREARKQAEERVRQSRYRSLQLIFNGVLAVFTILTAGIVLYQSRVMREQTDVSKKNAESAEEAVHVARDTLISGNESVSKTLNEMQLQTASAKTSAEAARSALSLARENFRKDQRPYLWFKASNDVPGYFERSRQVIWTWHFVNFGKSPAYHITIRHYIILGAGDPVPGFYSHETQEGAPLVPNEDRFATAGSETAVSQTEFNRLLRETDSIELHAALEYSDSYGAKYKTTICVRHLVAGPTQFCAGNQIE